MTEEWCCEQLENLKIQENRINTLTEIRIRLSEVPSLEAVVTNKLLSAPEIYDCLESRPEVDNQRQQLDLASDILSICMSNLSINQNDLPRLLERSITHPNSKVRALALNTVLREVRVHSTEEVSIGDEFIQHVLKALQEEETAVGVPAMGILSIVLKDKLEKNFVKEALFGTLSQNETIKCRVYELGVNLAKHSPVVLQQVEFLLDRALSEIDNDDILVQVNIMEILVSLAEQNHGLLYLEKRQVFEVISKRVETMDQNPMDRLLVPGIMKFFGKIASLQPQKIIVGYPHMMYCLFETIRSGDPTVLLPAFDTMANLTQTQQGKLLLESNYSGDLKSIFEEYASCLRNLSSEIKNRAFNTLEVIFSVEGAISPELSKILQKWFSYLAGSPNMQFLMDYCRNPFPDIKVACLSFIRVICMQDWGIVAFKDTAGFMEYLLDRKIEFDKEAKYAKFALIKILANSSVFDVQTHLQLQTYINEGPYYVQSAMEIAVDGN